MQPDNGRFLALPAVAFRTVHVPLALVGPATLDGRGDHRMVMAAAVLGLAGAPIEIEGIEAVEKSYPAFFDDLSEVGATFGRA